MLRAMFGEPKRQDEGALAETYRAIRLFRSGLRSICGSEEADPALIRLDLWAAGLIRALDELEQSIYASRRYADRVWPEYEDELSDHERDDYYRYMYYYKNAFIRLFSLLDKTGYFMDMLFQLETAKVKPKFSYFTVLRQLYAAKRHTALEQQLYHLKVQYREPLDRLRKRRNLEIHSINAELIDDVLQAQSGFAERLAIERVADQLQELQSGYAMATESLKTIFHYASKIVREG